MLAQHGDKCGEQGDHQTRIHQTRDRDRLARRVFLNGRNGRRVTRDGGLVEGDENGAEEGGRLLVRIWSEVGMDVDDKGGADGGEQTGLQEHVR